jgi:tetratricopeptide (TPR) repeat protein
LNPPDNVPRAFISYSHDSPEHMDRVLEFSNRLRADGVDCHIDQDETSPTEGWLRWMRNQINAAEFVLAVCTEKYRLRFQGEEEPGIGLGANREGSIIDQHIYDDGGRNDKFLPVVLSARDSVHIPETLRPWTHYQLSDEHGYQQLRHRVTNRPETASPALDPRRAMPRRQRKQDFSVPSILWSVPYRRNPFFTGRDHVLKDLHQALNKGSTTVLTQAQAISGLGGIGKTQTAVEYAYRYRDDYKTVLWVRAESESSIISAFAEVAKLLDLPEKDARELQETIRAVSRWLTSADGWLLVCDNADQPEQLKPYLPIDPKGRILITSRAQVLHGLAKAVRLEVLTPEAALEFLLRRIERESYRAPEKDAAAEMARELGYLPLALEQAGAYISEKSARFQDYLASYRKRRLELLSESRPIAGDYERSVATTWSMNFREVEETSPASSDPLRFTAFLDPDSIPIILISKSREELGPRLSAALGGVEEDPLILDNLLQPLTRYSLVRRNVDSASYRVHRMVQEVIKGEMNERERRAWSVRAVLALNAAFANPEYANWHVCETLLPHAMVAANLIGEWLLESAGAARLLNEIGGYYLERARYNQAEPLLKRALDNWERLLGPDHPHVATSLNNLAGLYHSQGVYEKAEPLYKRALRTREKTLGPDHPDLAQTLNNLAGLYYGQGRYADAEPLHHRVLQMRERALDPEHPNLAQSLNNLAMVYDGQGRHEDAEPLYNRALNIWEKSLGPDHPDVARGLNNLAELYRVQGRYEKAEPLYKRALGILESALGPDDPVVPTSLSNLALLYVSQERYQEAEPLYKRALAMREKVLGPDHPDVATSLNNLAGLYDHQGRLEEAEQLYRQAMEMRQKALGPDHPAVAPKSEQSRDTLQESGKTRTGGAPA